MSFKKNTMKLLGAIISLTVVTGLIGCEKGCNKKVAVVEEPTVNPNGQVVPPTVPNGERAPTHYHDRLKAEWAAWKEAIHQQWNLLTAEDIAEIDGDFDRLSQKIQIRYQKAKEEADQLIKDFIDNRK